LRATRIRGKRRLDKSVEESVLMGVRDQLGAVRETDFLLDVRSV
jgi:hypothetical protein